MRMLYGKKLAEGDLKKIKKKVKKEKLKLQLSIVQVGKNPSSESFIKQKEKACKKAGIRFRIYQFPKGISQKNLKKEVKKVVEDPKNSGIVIQLPLPKNIDAKEILDLVPFKKDVDVLSSESWEKFLKGRLLIFPPVVCAVAKICKQYKIKIKRKKVVLVGRGKLVGKPLAVWIKRKKGKLTIVHSSTRNISSFTKKADILISGTGKPNLIKGDMIKKGSVIIDCGTSSQKTKTKGDVDFKSVSKKAGFITPVPGGIGPLTVTCLIENLVKLNNR
ncbi:tetrahydrofolate dehydrogenase/cyclohydrolase catalytic domain-containing protein [Patescibacteria group bacterium]